jgi:hypothetical protein
LLEDARMSETVVCLGCGRGVRQEEERCPVCAVPVAASVLHGEAHPRGVVHGGRVVAGMAVVAGAEVLGALPAVVALLPGAVLGPAGPLEVVAVASMGRGVLVAVGAAMLWGAGVRAERWEGSVGMAVAVQTVLAGYVGASVGVAVAAGLAVLMPAAPAGSAPGPGAHVLEVLGLVRGGLEIGVVLCAWGYLWRLASMRRSAVLAWVAGILAAGAIVHEMVVGTLGFLALVIGRLGGWTEGMERVLGWMPWVRVGVAAGVCGVLWPVVVGVVWRGRAREEKKLKREKA